MPPTDDLLDSDEPVFPEPGAKLRFRGVRPFWYTDVIANAERDLKIGAIYTLKSIRSYSSWTEVMLEETGDVVYNHIWFEICSATPSG